MILAAVALGAMTGCGQQTADSAPAGSSKEACETPQARSQGRVTSEVDGPYEDSTLSETAEVSDLVVSGTVTQACAGNLLSTDDSLEYTIFTVQPDDEGASPLEIAYPTQVDGNPFVVEGQALPTIGAEGIWFLTDVPAQFDFTGYVLTSSASGIIFDDAGRVVNKGAKPIVKRAKALGSKAAILRAAS